jgi:transcriptional regulator with XRE-family HTH domain
MPSLSERLRELRGELSLYEVEKRTGIDRKVLSRYEQGQYQPSKDNLKKLADCYNAAHDELLILYFKTLFPQPAEQQIIIQWEKQQ